LNNDTVVVDNMTIAAHVHFSSEVKIKRKKERKNESNNAIEKHC